MNITMQLAVVAVAACLCLADGAPDGRLVRTKQQRPTRGFKNVEMMTARGFGKRDRSSSRTEHYIIEVPRRKFNPKSSLMVASDFGKRSGNDDRVEEEEEIRHTRGGFKTKNILIARGYGKRDDEDYQRVYNMDNIWELLDGSTEKEGQEGTEDKTIESIPLEWFTNEMLNNPELARSVVRKFIDLNQDSMLSSDELLRNTV